MILKLDSSNFESYINENSLPVLADFYSDGCIPCRRMSPLISRAETEYTERLDFAKVNIGANPDLVAKYSVEAAPTLIIFKNGEEISRLRGAADEAAFKEFIDNALLKGEEL